jgi:hypothetical protein
VVSSLLSEEMRWKNMEGKIIDALFARWHSRIEIYLSPQVGYLSLKVDLNILESL